MRSQEERINAAAEITEKKQNATPTKKRPFVRLIDFVMECPSDWSMGKITEAWGKLKMEDPPGWKEIEAETARQMKVTKEKYKR